MTSVNSILDKISADNIKYFLFLFFFQTTGFDNYLTICTKCQSLFSEKNKKNIINLLFVDLDQRVVNINGLVNCQM